MGKGLVIALTFISMYGTIKEPVPVSPLKSLPIKNELIKKLSEPYPSLYEEALKNSRFYYLAPIWRNRKKF